jgi:leucyl aminopeptidase
MCRRLVASKGGAVIAPVAPLQEFAKGAAAWLHIDTGAWTQAAYACSGRPEGGEALGLRALLAFIVQRYGGAGQQQQLQNKGG